MTTHSCLNIIKIIHEHAHFVIGMLQKAKAHGNFSKPSYGPLHYYTHKQQSIRKKKLGSIKRQ